MGFLTPNIKKLVKEDDVDSLVKCLSHKKADIRKKAFDALFPKAKTDATILEELKKFTKDKEPKLRIAATLKLAQLGLKDIMDDLKFAIVNGTKIEKIDTLRTLAENYKAGDESVSNLVVLALNDKAAMVQIESMKTMGAMKDHTAVFHLAEMLHDQRHAMRIEAVNSLGQIATNQAIDLLIGSLMDKDTQVRKAARESLLTIRSDRAMKAISDAPFMLLVKRMNSSVAIKIETIKNIAKQKITEGIPLIRKACSDEYKNVRIEAIRALSLFKDKASLPVLTRSIDDPYYDVRLETVKTLERIMDRQALLLVEKGTKDYNHNVREEAKRIYYHLLNRLERLEKRDDEE